MNPHNDKSPFGKFMASPLAFLLSLIIFGILIYSLVSVIYKQKKAQESRIQAEEELQALRDQKTSLESEIGLLSSDFGQEKALREKFGVVKEGEEIIVIVNEEKEEVEEEKSGISRFFRKIFSRK